jgi:kinesin family protein 6/9
MVRSEVQVCVRTRPTSSFAEGNLFIDPAGAAVRVHVPKTAGQVVNNQQEDWAFRFHQVLHNASQEDVYAQCAQDIGEPPSHTTSLALSLACAR